MSASTLFSAFKATILVVLALGIIGCDNLTEPEPTLAVPAVYDTTGYSLNTVDQRQLVNDMAAVIDHVKSGRTVGSTIDAGVLQQAFATLAPSIESQHRAEIEAFVNDAIAAGGIEFSLRNAPAQSGGVSGGYIFNGSGWDINEQIEKRLFAYVLYRKATELMNGPLTTATIDKVVALYGASPVFANSYRDATHPDRFIANYASRRDKNDGNGVYTRMAFAFRMAKAAIRAGDAYTTERDAALENIRTQWERSQMATVVNYLYSVIGKLSATSVDDATLASAAHSYGEGAGILIGWKAVNSTSRIMTDATLQAALSNLSVDAPYRLWSDPVTWLPRVEEVTRSIQSTYGFTDAEMMDFRKNWVTEQGR